MRRFFLGFLFVFILSVILKVATPPVFGLGCGEACGGTEINPQGTPAPRSTDCGACCTVGHPDQPACSAGCNSVSKVYAWSIGNTCTNWCDNGSCYYSDNLEKSVKNQVCCSGHPYDTRVVTCGTNYDFDSGVGNGADLVSSKKWLANDTAPATNSYQLMYQQFGSPTRSPTHFQSAWDLPISTMWAE